MKTITISYTIPVEVEVPDDFPLSVEEIQKIATWKANDHCDGRHPFSIEMMFEGAQRASTNYMEDSIFYHYCNKIEQWFGRRNFHIEGRNALIDKWTKTLRRSRASVVKVTVMSEDSEGAWARRMKEYDFDGEKESR